MKKNDNIRSLEVKVGNIVIGGDNPIVVQTMCNVHTADIAPFHLAKDG